MCSDSNVETFFLHCPRCGISTPQRVTALGQTVCSRCAIPSMLELVGFPGGGPARHHSEYYDLTAECQANRDASNSQGFRD